MYNEQIRDSRVVGNHPGTPAKKVVYKPIECFCWMCVSAVAYHECLGLFIFSYNCLLWFLSVTITIMLVVIV